VVNNGRKWEIVVNIFYFSLGENVSIHDHVEFAGRI